MATVTFGIYTRADLETKLPLTLANLAVAFSAPPRRTHEYKRITNLELPALYELRPGTSIHLRRLYELEKPGRLPDRFYGESFVLPLGDDHEACGILNFVTTNIDLSQNFSAAVRVDRRHGDVVDARRGDRIRAASDGTVARGRRDAMTIDATVERTGVVGVVTGVVDELVARVAAISDAQSGPGPPDAVIIAGQRVELGPESVLVGRSTSMFGIDHPKVSRRHVGVQLVDGVLIASDLEFAQRHMARPRRRTLPAHPDGGAVARRPARHARRRRAPPCRGSGSVVTIWRTQLRDPQERLHDVFVDGEVTTSTEALERELEQLGFHAKPIGFHGVPIRSAGHDRRPRAGARFDADVRGARPGAGAAGRRPAPRRGVRTRRRTPRAVADRAEASRSGVRRAPTCTSTTRCCPVCTAGSTTPASTAPTPSR